MLHQIDLPFRRCLPVFHIKTARLHFQSTWTEKIRQSISMQHYKNYLIAFSDRFIPSNFPLVMEEIMRVKREVDSFANLFKVEMILSFLRNRTIHAEFVGANRALASFITSGYLFSGETASLFQAASGNIIFCRQLEQYVETVLIKVNTGQNY